MTEWSSNKQVVPIYNENCGGELALIGVWASNSDDINDETHLSAGLGQLAASIMEALHGSATRHVDNDVVDVGNYVCFYNGTFTMIGEHKSPSEVLSEPRSNTAYVLFDWEGVGCLKAVDNLLVWPLCCGYMY